MSDVAARLARVSERVQAAAARAGRDPAAVTIVAVSKRQPPAAIAAAYAAGVRHVGENYVQELVAKLDQVTGADELSWHFIGHLQRNKVKHLVGRVALIHAVDSLALAREIDRQIARQVARQGQIASQAHAGPDAGARPQRILVAVNVAGEEQKSGVAPADAPALLAAIGELAHIECVGLMTMPPLAARPEDSRPHFRALAELRERLRAPGRRLPELSMGTTDDFEVAVEEGATLVRVGTAVFGPRSA